MSKRILVLLSSVLLCIGTVLSIGIPAAQAQSGDTFETGGIYINAWNGGPEVNSYDGSTTYDDFTIINNSYRNFDVQIVDTDGGPYDGWCIGDYGDNPSNPDTGLVGGCDTAGTGWGSLFEAYECGNTGELGFWNIHWGGWLDPSSASNGQPFILNDGFEDCYTGSYVG
jgi:hypothetical protein